MSDKTVEQIIAELKEPFNPDDILWRIGQAGQKQGGGVWAKVLAYVDDRAIQDRLDAVVGAENWQIAYSGMNGNATTATISIRLNGEWISKSNGAGATDIEAIKGGYSGASKRAASVWGIGRYLYNLKDTFAIITENKRDNKAKLKVNGGQDVWYYWKPPQLPDWAVPGGTKQEAPMPFADYKKEMNSALSVKDVKDIARKYSKMVDGKVWSAKEIEEAGNLYHSMSAKLTSNEN